MGTEYSEIDRLFPKDIEILAEPGRFLIATARVFELTLVTADAALLAARQVRMLGNR